MIHIIQNHFDDKSIKFFFQYFSLGLSPFNTWQQDHSKRQLPFKVKLESSLLVLLTKLNNWNVKMKLSTYSYC